MSFLLNLSRQSDAGGLHDLLVNFFALISETVQRRLVKIHQLLGHRCQSHTKNHSDIFPIASPSLQWVVKKCEICPRFATPVAFEAFEFLLLALHM